MDEEYRLNTPPTRVKIFGERNSGTNLLGRLLEQSPQLELLPGGAPYWLRRSIRDVPASAKRAALDGWDRAVYPRTLGWKHAYITNKTVRRAQQGGVRCIAIVKHPVAWLTSLRRHPYHIDVDHAGKLAHVPLRRERLQVPIGNIRQLWALKSARYVELADLAGFQIVRFEDLVADQQHTISLIAEQLQVDVEPIRPLARDVKGSTRSASEIADYYANATWRNESGPGDMEWWSSLDAALLRQLDYNR